MTWSMRTRSVRRRAVRAPRRAHLLEERGVDAAVVGELGVEGDREQRALAGGDRVAVDGGEHLDRRPVLRDPRRADEHGADGRALDPGELEVGLEGVQLAAERVALGDDVHEPEMLAVEHDQPGARAEDRPALGVEVAQRVGQPLARDAERHRRRLAARHDETVEAVEVGRGADLADVGAELAQGLRVRGEAALQREHADERPVVRRRGAVRTVVYQPRPASSCVSSSLRASRLCIAVPRPSDAFATRAASRKCVVASTIAAARGAGSSDLKMPEPTNTASAPSCMTSDASAGVAMPPAQNRGTGRRPSWATRRTRSCGAWSAFAAPKSSASSSVWRRRISPVIERRWRTASTMSPVPASPLERIIAAPSEMRRSASPRFVAPHTNGMRNAHLSMWWASSAGVRTSDSSM